MDEDSDRSENDDDQFEGIRLIGGDSIDDEVTPGDSVFGGDSIFADDDELPPWHEPAASEDAEDDDLEVWSSLGRDDPQWDTGDSAVAVPVVGDVDSPQSDEFFGFDDGGDGDDLDDGKSDDDKDFDPPLLPPAEAEVAPVSIAGNGGNDGLGEAPTTQTASGRVVEPASKSDRNMGMAIATGVGLAAAFVVSMMVGPWLTMLLVAAIIGLAVAEFYNAVRPVGFQPAVLLGLAASVSLVLAAYWRGESALPLVLFLTVVFSMLWYLTGVGTERPVMNLGITFLGVLWIGLLGSFAALMLKVPTDGKWLLFTAVAVTAGHDIGALVIGRLAGRSPLSSASPNKTVEGLVGGAAMALVAALLLFLFEVEPFAGNGPAGSVDKGGFFAIVLLGVVGAVAAPLGDLVQSILKRDLGIKDMGNMLPGHGGLLDRFDALLFVLPAVYYLARIILY